MKRYIKAARKSGMNLDNVITWNNYYYGIQRTKRGERYFKSETSRFDDSFGGTKEISADEYQAVAEKHAKMFR